MTCSTYIACPRLYDGFLLTSCKAVQNADCPDDCRYDEHRQPFWERQNLTSKCSGQDGAGVNLDTEVCPACGSTRLFGGIFASRR